jgi:SOS-response transcriptional repressor LexA
MPAAVVSIGSKKRAHWSLLEVARPGRRPVPYGILFADEESGELKLRLRDAKSFGDPEEDDLGENEADVLAGLEDDLLSKSRERGAASLLQSLEDSLSHFLRISDRTAIAYAGSAQFMADRLFDEYVDAAVEPFVTHLPFYAMRAAATKFGEGSESEQEGWVRAPAGMRLTEGMFVAQVVGRSMEPRIPDGSYCIFRAPVTGSRQGRVVMIEIFGAKDETLRYTLKYYAPHAAPEESAEREAHIRLEPLNPEFEAFELESDQFRVVAEFVRVLSS